MTHPSTKRTIGGIRKELSRFTWEDLEAMPALLVSSTYRPPEQLQHIGENIGGLGLRYLDPDEAMHLLETADAFLYTTQTKNTSI